MPIEFTYEASWLWRDYVTDGVPESGAHKPPKAELRFWGTEVEDYIAANADAIAANAALIAAHADRLAALESSIVTGAIMPFGGGEEPGGWLFCFGQAVSRTTYEALFVVIGTTYGVGDGETNFNLPDLRGRVVAGKDDMGGTSANRLTDQSGGLDGDTLGDTGGAETNTLTTAQMPAHRHQAGNSSGVSSGAAGSFRTGTVEGASVDTTSTGGGGAHNNVQPTIILNYIIYSGLAA